MTIQTGDTVDILMGVFRRRLFKEVVLDPNQTNAAKVVSLIAKYDADGTLAECVNAAIGSVRGDIVAALETLAERPPIAEAVGSFHVAITKASDAMHKHALHSQYCQRRAEELDDARQDFVERHRLWEESSDEARMVRQKVDTIERMLPMNDRMSVAERVQATRSRGLALAAAFGMQVMGTADANRQTQTQGATV